MTGELKRIDFPDTDYTIKQSLIRNKYHVYDSSGELVVKTKQKIFRMKEEFPFKNAEGEVVFRLKAENVFDIAGDYNLIDEETGETVVVLEKKFTFFKHVWKVKRPENGELIATVESTSALLEALRSFSEILDLIPQSYSITDRNGNQIGSIKGRFRLRDVYDLHIDEIEDLPREALVASAIAIDALEGN